LSFSASPLYLPEVVVFTNLLVKLVDENTDHR
jgi:hypothetical protein